MWQIFNEYIDLHEIQQKVLQSSNAQICACAQGVLHVCLFNILTNLTNALAPNHQCIKCMQI